MKGNGTKKRVWCVFSDGLKSQKRPLENIRTFPTDQTVFTLGRFDSMYEKLQ